MIFARIKADGFHACGIFQEYVSAVDVLCRCAEVKHGRIDFERFAYQHKPESAMDEQDIQDAGAMVEGAVVVL